MTNQTDWRLQGQESYLTGRQLRFVPYVRRSQQWEHEHCEFCSAKFSDNADDLHTGYVTKDQHYWICPDCFRDFKDQFRWEVSGG